MFQKTNVLKHFCIISAPIELVWGKIASGDFTWWDIVNSSTLSSGASPMELGTFVTVLKCSI